MYATYKPTNQNLFNDTQERLGESRITMNVNTNNTNNTNVQSLTAAIAALTKVLEEAINIAKEESTTATTGTTATTTEATTTEATTEAPIIVIDDDDSVIGVGFKGSMIEQDPMDPIPAVSEAKADTAAEADADDTAEAEETIPAVEDVAEEMLDKIVYDISTLYDLIEYALRHEGKNIESDRSPYAPKDNVVGICGEYKVFISKEIIKDGDHVDGSFRMIIKDKCIVDPIMDLDLHLIDNHFKMLSSKNTHRMEKLKESHEIMRLMEIVDEVSSLVMSKYISK